MQLLFIHGIAQKGKSESSLTTEWVSDLAVGAKVAGMQFAADQIASCVLQPFFGDLLYDYAYGRKQGAGEDVTRGEGEAERRFERDFAYEMQGDLPNELGHGSTTLLPEDEVRSSGRASDVGGSRQHPMTLDDLEDEERAIYNAQGVLFLARFLEGRCKRFPRWVVDSILPEVGAYLTIPEAMYRVDKIVTDKIPLKTKDLVVVAHSLGAVVACRVLTARNDVAVSHLITIGGPLGVRAVTDRLQLNQPFHWPDNVASWTNFFDKRDIVSLARPVDRDSLFQKAYEDQKERARGRFDVHNFVDVFNDTDNHHGISGYFRDPLVARTILNSTGTNRPSA